MFFQTSLMLINKDEKIKNSPIYIGYLILKQLKRSKEEKLIIHDIIENIKQNLGVVHYRQLIFSLIFLYESGIIDFAEPYIYKKND